MKDKLAQLKAKPWVAHLLRAWARYSNRMGGQFAAAVTYFSVLAMVPILMFGFSMLGMTLTVLRPDWLAVVKDEVTDIIGTGRFTDLIDQYLQNWRGVGLVGLLSLLYAGSGWVGNLRGAIRAQWRPEFEFDEKKRNFFLKIIINAGTLIVLLIGIGLTGAMAIIGTSLSNVVVRWLGLTESLVGRLGVRAGAIVVTVLCAWLLFGLIYWLLPREPAPLGARVKGALAAAVGLAALQLGAGSLMGLFSQNRAAALFGPVIVLMLVLNLFAQLALFIAAWIATAKQPAIAYRWNEADELLRGRSDTETAPGHWERADEDRARIEAEEAEEERKEAEEKALKEGRPLLPSSAGARRPLRVEAFRAQVERDPVSIAPDGSHPEPDPDVLVPQDVAANSVKVAGVTGYAVGAATGIGLGAMVAALLGRLVRR
ncbi:YhjD/YihY/BrkB family envelope integrity protein [Aestuariimicrobium ganziense]|uniref:YhjD/YihY/BrkB family envelope integrity protein n=1 Tax=Aestuariimicrobium ganziense TaxID=2773677 RepID=UPI0019418194|nr:YhjD/YihY/BrkB family envelope integrity protein [Aestuariimicrobium ganziense]